MKKNFLVVAVLLSVFVFGSAAGAAVNYYVSQIVEFKEDHKKTLSETYEEKSNHISGVIHRDLERQVRESIERIESETNEYLNKKIHDSAKDSQSQNEKEINKATEQAISDLKKYIDDLGKENK